MKKILAIILAMAMMLGLVACKSDKVDKEPTKPSISQNEQVDTATEPNDSKSHDTETNATEGDEDKTVEPTEVVDSAIDVNDRQAMWEDVFNNGKFIVDANSFSMTLADTMNITILSDEGGEGYIEIGGNLDGGTIKAAIYQSEDGKTYYYSYSEAEGQTSEEWFECDIASDEDTLDGMMDGTASDAEEVTDLLSEIMRVEYVESVGDIDHINIYYPAPQTSGWQAPEGSEITFDSTVEFEYNGEVGQVRYTTYSNDSVSMTSHSWVVEIEDMDILFDWDFNAETLTLTNDGDKSIVLQCKVVEDHLMSNSSEDIPLAVIQVEVNSKTFAIQKMSVEQDGIATVIEFINCDDVGAFVSSPNKVDGTKAADEAAFEFAMLMWGLTMACIPAN